MSECSISCHIRLARKPMAVNTSSGKAMTTCSGAVNLPCRANESGQETQWFSLVSFGKVADDLLRHEKGDLINVIGQLQINKYTKADDEVVEQLSIVIDQILSARTTRSKPTSSNASSNQNQRPKQSVQAAMAQGSKSQQQLYTPAKPKEQQPASMDFDDEIPF